VARRLRHGGAVQVDPVTPKFKAPVTKRLKLNCDVLLSTSAFKFNLRHYAMVLSVPGVEAQSAALRRLVAVRPHRY